MSAAVPVLTALLLAAFAGILLQRYSPAFTLLLSLGAAVWLLLRLAQPLRWSEALLIPRHPSQTGWVLFCCHRSSAAEGAGRQRMFTLCAGRT